MFTFQFPITFAKRETMQEVSCRQKRGFFVRILIKFYTRVKRVLCTRVVWLVSTRTAGVTDQYGYRLAAVGIYMYVIAIHDTHKGLRLSILLSFVRFVSITAKEKKNPEHSTFARNL